MNKMNIKNLIISLVAALGLSATSVIADGHKYTVDSSNYTSYTLVRYYGGLKKNSQYLLLRSPIMFFPTAAIDWKIGQAFKFNLGITMGYNTVVNDYGQRGKSISILFGTYF